IFKELKMKKIYSIIVLLLISVNLYSLSYEEYSYLQAAEYGNLEEVKKFINSSNYNFFSVKDNNGYTGLMLACKNNHLEVVRYLIENGDSLFTVNNEGYTAIDLSGGPEVLSFLLQTYYNQNNKNYLDIRGSAIFGYYVSKGNMDNIRVLVNYGLDVNMLNNYGQTVLIWAASVNNFEVLKIFLEGGADTDLKDKYGYTPLIYASRDGKTEMVKLLLKYRANPNIRDDDGLTALMRATLNNYSDIVKILLENKANANIQDNRGYTALIWAATYGKTESAKLLLSYGANPNIKNNRGETAYDTAKINKRYEIVNLLERYK
ncbi:ankyrin repeat domain-containing protein, partial [Brachyspira pulli]|uniref:ankyrin repeat domain-containing protein n=1 Tax=Brachyspira pulli TaxID=310721 RepID=UPI003005CF82